MRRVVEFDLVTKIEANARFASQAGMFAKAARTKAQREAVRAVLRSSLGSPPPLHVVQVGDRFEHVGAIGLAVRNTIAVTFTRIAPGQTADAWENLPGAFKGVKDEVAAWLGVDDAEGAGIEWKPPAQEKSATGVYRVRIEIVDKLTGADRVVRLAETRSAGVQAERRVKRAITKAKKATPDRDPGEEKSAREVADCTTCGALRGEACQAQKAPHTRMLFGVHVARAHAAGLHVPDDDRAKVKPARAARGPRKLVPAARPAGQAVLPMLRAFACLPWENPPCSVCGGTGNRPNLGPRGPLTETCGGCNGTGRAKGRVLTRAARYDGLDDPPTTITASVPAEHVQRYGSTVTLTRQKFDSRATGPCWVYATTDERTTT